MSGRPLADSRYPAWMNAWNSKAADVDEQIIAYFQNAGEHTSYMFETLGHQLHSWWDKQNMEDAAREEYLQVKADAALFKSQLEGRVDLLIQEGRLALAKLSREHAGPDDAGT